MIIKEVCADDSRHKYATVQLNYEELRDLANALYAVSKTTDEFKDIHAKSRLLFSLVKHGTVTPDTVDHLYKTYCSSEAVECK